MGPPFWRKTTRVNMFYMFSMVFSYWSQFSSSQKCKCLLPKKSVAKYPSWPKQVINPVVTVVTGHLGDQETPKMASLRLRWCAWLAHLTFKKAGNDNMKHTLGILIHLRGSRDVRIQFPFKIKLVRPIYHPFIRWKLGLKCMYIAYENVCRFLFQFNPKNKNRMIFLLNKASPK